MKKLIVMLAVTSLLMVGVLSVSAQDGMSDVPMVEVFDQLSLDGTVSVHAVYSEGPGFIVIHIDNGGRPGPVAGYAAIPPGHSEHIRIKIDTTMATPMLFAMLHADTGEVGVYEFGTVDGADGPVSVDGNVVTPAFSVAIVHVDDQFAAEGTVNVHAVGFAQAGWVVIHESGEDGGYGPVIGHAALTAGTNTNVAVTLESEATNKLWAMLHVDTGEAGVYEFGTVEGADTPLVLDGAVASAAFWTVPHMRVHDQIVLHGDNYEGMDMMGDDMMGPAVYADSVLSAGPGWLVIHSDNNGAPGPVLGMAQVNDGLNKDVMAELSGEITPVVWPMLHVDTGEAGVYEFGTVEGADGPVRVNDQVLTFPIHIAPSMDLPADGTSLNGNLLEIESVLIDAPGWLVIHSDNNGAPGPVLNYVRLQPGLNTGVHLELDPAAAGSQVFPMLHYDTGAPGVYEFGTVDGADGPVRFGDAVVVAPLAIN
jgi:hypothetical protein